jgi:C-terminal processing protease CtpA/Prc
LAYSISDNSAENKNELRAGDEILKINGADCTKMGRSEATNYVKKLSGDLLTLVIRQ